MAPKSARRRQMEAAALYPLDWVEERTGLVGGVKYFLFRNVPRDVNWMQTLGAATLTAFIVQAVTGVFLAMFLQGGSQIGPDTIARFYSMHMLLIPGALIGLILLHLYLVVRLGVTSPPWSATPAGRERADEKPEGAREGLIRPPDEPGSD